MPLDPRTMVVSTQTPLLLYGKPPEEGGPAPPARLSPGGVCRMVLPTIQQLRAAGWLRRAHWYSLQPGAPGAVDLDETVRLHHLQLAPAEMQAYARSKEKLWADIHGLPTQPFSGEDFRQYARYNARTALALLEHVGDLDVAYIHDFQLMQVGALVGLAAPCVLRWHVPWDPARMPAYTRHFLLRVMEDFDTVVVSTRRDLQGLHDAGFHGRVRQVYPHIEARDWPDATPAQVAALEAAWGLRPDDPLVLLVARMDPMKRQDLAIQAFRRVLRSHPRARLFLVGNGSFSGPLGGHAGKGKAAVWREQLEALVAELGLGDGVHFTHWVPDGLLAAAYQRASVLLLPSDVEGFGLTVLEAWRYGRPVVVSTGAGAAEIVTDGVNGLLVPPGDADALAAAVERVLSDRTLAERLGANGRDSLPSYVAEAANPHVRAVLDEAIEGFGTA